MPELPEVETIRRQIEPRLVGRRLGTAWSHPSERFTDAATAAEAAVVALDRRGKYLIATVDRGHRPWPWGPRAELVVHLGMTGSLRVLPEPSIDDGYRRAWWELGPHPGGPRPAERLVFRDVRRFGLIAVVAPGDYRRLPTLDHLGPEPLSDDFDGERLWLALRASRRHVKTQLLSQRPVAGVGNIYADEACWMAGVNPADRTISRPRAQALAGAIRAALTTAIERGGTTLRDYVDAEGAAGTNQVHLQCYGKGGDPCLRCATALKTRVLDGRTTTWCPTCQPRR